MSSRGFVKLQRGEATDELVRDKNALHLLTVIALRARFTDEPNLAGLGFGQAFLGDFKEFDLTEKEYRGAKQRLERFGLVKFKASSRGTVATLVDGRAFELRDTRQEANRGGLKGGQKGGRFSEVNEEIGADQRADARAADGRTKGGQGATNSECKHGKQGENAIQNGAQNVEATEVTEKTASAEASVSSGGFIPSCIQDVYELADREEVDSDTATAWWNAHASCGFTINGKPMHDWRLAFMSWAQADALRNRPQPDGIGGKAWWEWIRAEGYETSIANRYIVYNSRHGWKRKNPKTGRMESIFDHKKHFTAFYESLSHEERINAD